MSITHFQNFSSREWSKTALSIFRKGFLIKTNPCEPQCPRKIYECLEIKLIIFKNVCFCVGVQPSFRLNMVSFTDHGQLFCLMYIYIYSLSMHLELMHNPIQV